MADNDPPPSPRPAGRFFVWLCGTLCGPALLLLALYGVGAVLVFRNTPASGIHVTVHGGDGWRVEHNTPYTLSVAERLVGAALWPREWQEDTRLPFWFKGWVDTIDGKLLYPLRYAAALPLVFGYMTLDMHPPPGILTRIADELCHQPYMYDGDRPVSRRCDDRPSCVRTVCWGSKYALEAALPPPPCHHWLWEDCPSDRYQIAHIVNVSTSHWRLGADVVNGNELRINIIGAQRLAEFLDYGMAMYAATDFARPTASRRVFVVTPDDARVAAAFVVAYLLAADPSLSYDEALAEVRWRRPDAQPPEEAERVLRYYEETRNWQQVGCALECYYWRRWDRYVAESTCAVCDAPLFERDPYRLVLPV